MRTSRGRFLAAVAVGAGLLAACEGDGLPWGGSEQHDGGGTSDGVCALPPQDAWAEVGEKALASASWAALPPPSEASAAFDGIAVVQVEGAPRQVGQLVELKGTVTEAVQGVQNGEQITLSYDDLGATPEQMDETLAQGDRRVLALWKDEDDHHRLTLEGLWYEVEVKACDGPVGTLLSNPAQGIGSPHGWENSTTVDGLVAQLSKGGASSP